MTSKDNTKTEVWHRVTDAEVQRLYRAIGYRVESGLVKSRGEWVTAYWILDPQGKGLKGERRDFASSEDSAWTRFYGWKDDPRRSLDAVYKIADALLGTGYVVELYSDPDSAEAEIYSRRHERAVIHGNHDPLRTVAVCRALLTFLDWREAQS